MGLGVIRSNLGNSMNIKEFCDYTGLTKQAVYKQIREGRAYGRFFKRGNDGKWFIDKKRVK